MFCFSSEEASPTAERRGSEKKKRVKMSDLRAFVETKMFSKSEKNLEKVGLETGSANGKRPLQHAVRLFPFKKHLLSSFTNGVHATLPEKSTKFCLLLRVFVVSRIPRSH